MNSLLRIQAIIIKQVKDSLKNRLIMMVFFMLPLLAIVFNSIMDEEQLNGLIPSFVTINTVMVPVIFMSSVVAEEKEKRSLQMLIMSNVKAWEYLFGVGICVFLQSILSSSLFLIIFDIPANKIVVFFAALTIGIIYSLIIGAIIAILAKNQMNVGPIAAPVSMLLGLVPMFADMNEKLKGFARVFYTYYIRKMFYTLEFDIDLKTITILIINFLLLLLLFILLYRFKRIDDE